MIVAIIFATTSRERLVRGLKPTNCDFSAVKSRNNHYVVFRIPAPDDSLETLAEKKVRHTVTDDVFTISVGDLDLEAGEYPWRLDIYESPDDKKFDTIVNIPWFGDETLVEL